MSLRRACCPTCKKPVSTIAETRPRDFPFCSERCRLADLYKWLNEEYSIPVAPSPDYSPSAGPPSAGPLSDGPSPYNNGDDGEGS